MTLNEYLNQGREERTVGLFSGYKSVKPAPALVCNDGFTISVQASNTHYCEPRESFDDCAQYDSFELGFPNRIDDLITEYAEDMDTKDTIFPYVPREVVEALIEKHGGIKS